MLSRLAVKILVGVLWLLPLVARSFHVDLTQCSTDADKTSNDGRNDATIDHIPLKSLEIAPATANGIEIDEQENMLTTTCGDYNLKSIKSVKYQ